MTSLRQPSKQESIFGMGMCSFIALLVFGMICYPELRKNLVFRPAMCQPYFDGALRPEIRPYRHCTSSCFGCRPTWNPTPCSFKLGMHSRINEYNLDAAWQIAGTCAGTSCCAHQVCNKCTRTETRCRRRRLSAQLLGDDDDDDDDYEEWVEQADDEETDGPPAPTTPWMDSVASLRRRLQSSCQKVTSTYDCNCRCARYVAAKMCSVRCVPYWRAFMPIRITATYASDGLYAADQDVSPARARANFDSMLAADAPSSSDLTPVQNQSDAQAFNTEASVYSPFDAASRFAPLVSDGFARVVTLVYEHRASRDAALRRINAPWFAPGEVTECWYEPDWHPTSPTIPSDHVAFNHEMGYRLWKWSLLLVFVGFVGLFGALYVRPDLLGGYVVVASSTTLHTNVEVHKDKTFAGSSMY